MQDTGQKRHSSLVSTNSFMPYGNPQPRHATTINAKSLGTLTVFFDLAGERSPLPLKTMLIYTGFIHSK